MCAVYQMIFMVTAESQGGIDSLIIYAMLSVLLSGAICAHTAPFPKVASTHTSQWNQALGVKHGRARFDLNSACRSLRTVLWILPLHMTSFPAFYFFDQLSVGAIVYMNIRSITERFLTPSVHCWDPPDPWHFMSRGGSEERISDMSKHNRPAKINSCSSS